MVSLLDRENFDFKSEIRIWSLELTVLHLSSMCGFQVRHLSRVTPRYLTSFSVGTVRFFNVTCGESRFLNEKVIWTDF